MDGNFYQGMPNCTGFEIDIGYAATHRPLYTDSVNFGPVIQPLLLQLVGVLYSPQIWKSLGVDPAPEVLQNLFHTVAQIEQILIESLHYE